MTICILVLRIHAKSKKVDYLYLGYGWIPNEIESRLVANFKNGWAIQSLIQHNICGIAYAEIKYLSPKWKVKICQLLSSETKSSVFSLCYTLITVY